MKGFLNQVGEYFNNNNNNSGSSRGGGQGVSTHNIPQQHNIRGRTIQEEKILSEGGFGYIWRAYDVNTREVFALKRMICQGQDRVQIAKRELKNFEMLPNHPNITRFYGGSITPTSDGCVALFLMELCDGGSLFDLMTQNIPNKIPEKKLIQIIYEAAKGIRALHQANPPITHRDIKIENILKSGGIYKLCDFGSCSTQTIDFRNVPKSQYEDYEDLFNKSTTMMYRPPEMCEPAKQMFVDTKVDIWMLGCVLFTMAFYIHPFVDSSKLAIVDANYRFPSDSPYTKKFHDFIRNMITPDPSFRPSIHDVISTCEGFDRIQSIQLNPVAQSLKEKEEARDREEKRYEQNGRPIKKFNGDIPMDELMKLQQKIMAAHKKDDDDEGEGACTFIKNKPAPPPKKNQKTEKQLEQIRQQFNKPSQSSSSNSSNQQQQRQNSSGSSNFQNEFWNFNAPSSNQQQQSNKNNNNNGFNNNSNQQKQVQDPFDQFGFGSSNNNSNQNQASDPFDNFNFSQNNNNNNNNSNSIFDQFGFQNSSNNMNNNNNNSNNNNNNNNNNGVFDQFGFQNNNNNNNFNSNSNNFNSNNNNNNSNQNAWEFYENTNEVSSQNKFNSNNSYNQQVQNNNNYNQQQQQYGSTNSYNQQQSYSGSNQNDIFAQFGSNNQNNAQNQNQLQQQSNFAPQPQQKQQLQNVNLLDLDDEVDNKNKGGVVNLLDLGIEL